ncbi:Heat induced stress protein YflT [Anatilimnocola aggregata]|uniref:Heat induced stress protein YflT n=1 Tax=Anatilimnocola aggregata TaxID=2528021 RepID=A0A517YN89_9BACT|nr:hypothetical protein [Anatilimnocola aggregata]QDU31682.1 Heat induced stress protein YflT [Anatilimnocola aggregata]
MTSVYCLATSNAQAVRIADRLRTGGFSSDDISVLCSNNESTRDFAVDNSTKAPEGTAIGASTGAVVGGTLGWLAGIGLLAIPGVGPLIAAGPIMAALSGAAAGGTLGGVSGALIGMGIPEYEAQRYEGKLQQGHILLSVHADDSDEAARVRTIFTEEKAEDISTGSEASVGSSR